MPRNYVFVLCLLLSLNSFAQQRLTQNNLPSAHDRCGHQHVQAELYQAHPNLRPENNPAHQELELHTQQYLQELNNINTAARMLDIWTIPVVVHVVHDNGPENLTDAEIEDAIVLLNEDYRGINEEIPSEIHADFLNLVADCEVEFELANLDPNGLPTNGITRTVSNYTYAGDNVQMKEDIGWPRNKYLNIWLVNKPFANSSSSGFAYYPESVDDPAYEVYDGVVIAYWAFGRHDQTSIGYEHVLTHEVGHWANLKHTWGDQSDFGTSGACNDDDGVADTPNTEGHAFYGTCTLETFSCGTLDNNNNFMDYTGTCTGMYTLGQKARQRAALNSSVGNRNNLWSAQNLLETLGAPNASSLIYNPFIIEEDLANDGTVNGTLDITAENVSFSQSSGSFTQGTHYTVSGLPSGLSISISLNSNISATVTVSGQASAHADADDSNYTITFLNAAFVGVNAVDVVGSTNGQLEINFLDPYQIVCVDLLDPFAESTGQAWEYFAINYGNAEFGTWFFETDNFKLETYGKGAICQSGTRNIDPLGSGVYVGPNSTFTAPGNYPDQLDITTSTFTDWKGQLAYIGFRFENVGRTHYGWLKATVDAGGTKFTVLDGAYNTEPNGEIYTGDCGNGVVPQLAFANTSVQEGSNNDGSFSDTYNVTAENVSFSQSSGTFTEGSDYTVSSLPLGLSAVVTLTSSTTLEISLVGQASNHADADDTNFVITFLDAAFAGESAANVTNSSSSLAVDFLDPYGIECVTLGASVEVGIQDWEYFSLYYGDAEFGAWIYDGNNLKLETYGKGAVCYDGTRNIEPLPASTWVGPNYTFTEPGDYPDQLDISNATYTNWNGQTAYVGYRFSYNGNIHYGWLQLSVNPSGTSFTVIDGAYNTEPNAYILTGDCSTSGGSSPIVTISSTNPTCGASNGSATASTTGGTTPYTYQWSNGANTNSIYNLSAATYSVTVTDADGSTDTETITLTDPSGMSITTSVTNESLAGANDGAVDATVSGGASPYSYNWSNGSTSEDIAGLSGGTYSLTVTDSDGCTAETTSTVATNGGGGGTYCDASTALDYNAIFNVAFESINNASAWTSYSDYTSMVASVDPGNSYVLTITTQHDHWPEINVAAWIDWNADGDFYDTGEEVYNFTGPGPYTPSVTVPANATVGATRLRVRLGYGTTLDPCGEDTYQGEVEDYTVNIISVVASCDLPVPTAESVISGNVVKLEWGTASGAERYRIRYRPVGGSWTEKLTAADETFRFLNGLTPSTNYQYQLKSLCAAENSVWSSTYTFTTLGDVCDFPESTSVNITSATTASISWPTDADDVKWRIKYRIPGPTGTSWVTLNPTTPAVNLTSLVAGAEYKYKTKTKCAAAWTNWSGNEFFTMPNSLVEPSARETAPVLDAQINIFPNPTSSKINIQFVGAQESSTLLRVLDPFGKVVMTQQVTTTKGVNHLKLDLSNYNTGYYFIQLSNSNWNKTQRVLKF